MNIKTLQNKLVVSVSIIMLTVIVPFAANAASIDLRPSSPGFDSNNTVGVIGDAAPGFPTGSIASDGTGKTDVYLTPTQLFDREITLGDIKDISYWTKKGDTHSVDPSDWFINIYTKPYIGDISTATWYGDRIGTEPYFSENINDPADTWNKWSTDGSENTLLFFESTQGAPGATFGSYNDPTWDVFLNSNALSGQAYSTREVLTMSVQTGSAWADGFTGQVDALIVTLTDGTVGKINFEPEFVRSAEITSPTANAVVSGVVNFSATLTDMDNNDNVQWAVRAGSCTAGTGTVYGNVDNATTSFSWDNANFSSSIDMSGDTPGSYCFVFNPTESSSDTSIRLTQNFTLEAPIVTPTDLVHKNQCKNGGYKNFGFGNQGQCIRFVETGKDSR